MLSQSYQTLCDPRDCSPPGSSSHGDSPGKNIGVGCHALFQGIFPTQGLLESSSSSQGINLKRWIVSVRKMRQPLSFLGVPIYFKFKIIFYTFTKALEVWHFQFPLTQIYYLHESLLLFKQSSCFSDSLGISFAIYYLLPLMCPIVNVITLYLMLHSSVYYLSS